MTEEVVEIQLINDTDIDEFYTFSDEDRIKVIKLGLTLYRSGTRKLEYLNNGEWEKKMESLQSEHGECVSELEKKIGAAEKHLKEYSRESQDRQKILIEEVRTAEKQRQETAMNQLKNDNQRLYDKVETMHSQFDNRFDERLLSTRSFYEDKLSALTDKLDKVREDYEARTRVNIARTQNSTIKGQVGEEYVLGQLNMLFPRAELEDTHKMPGRGDFIMRDDNFTMMIETKNYSKNVQKSEIDKFYRDIDNPANSDMQCALFVSLNTGICCKDDFEFEIRNKIPILFIHKLQNNFTNIIMAVKFFKLIIDQNGIDLSNKEILDSFKNLSKNMRNNFNKQKTKIDRYYAEHLSLIAEQQMNTFELYKLVNIKF